MFRLLNLLQMIIICEKRNKFLKKKLEQMVSFYDHEKKLFIQQNFQHHTKLIVSIVSNFTDRKISYGFYPL